MRGVHRRFRDNPPFPARGCGRAICAASAAHSASVAGISSRYPAYLCQVVKLKQAGASSHIGTKAAGSMRTLPITREHTVQAVDVASPTASVGTDPFSRQNAALARSEKMKAVQRDGGRAIAEAPSARYRMRRRLHGIGWQSLILLAAIIDISVLCVELGGNGGLGIDTLTGLVLFIFTVDIVVVIIIALCIVIVAAVVPSVFFVIVVVPFKRPNVAELRVPG